MLRACDARFLRVLGLILGPERVGSQWEEAMEVDTSASPAAELNWSEDGFICTVPALRYLGCL